MSAYEITYKGKRLLTGLGAGAIIWALFYIPWAWGVANLIVSLLFPVFGAGK